MMHIQEILSVTLIALKSPNHWDLIPTLQMSRGLTHSSVAPKRAYFSPFFSFSNPEYIPEI